MPSYPRVTVRLPICGAVICFGSAKVRNCCEISIQYLSKLVGEHVDNNNINLIEPSHYLPSNGVIFNPS